MSEQTLVMEPVVIPPKFRRLYQQKYGHFTLDQFDFFLSQCDALDIDPRLPRFAMGKLIPSENPSTQEVVIQLGIMGYRAVAHDTGCLAGIETTEKHYDADNRLAAVTVTVYRLVQGQKCAFSFTARYEEYAPISLAQYRDTMPHHWLEKCAEAGAHRRAFPKQFANVYVQEELLKFESGSKSAERKPPADSDSQGAPADDVPEIRYDD